MPIALVVRAPHERPGRGCRTTAAPCHGARTGRAARRPLRAVTRAPTGRRTAPALTCKAPDRSVRIAGMQEPPGERGPDIAKKGSAHAMTMSRRVAVSTGKRPRGGVARDRAESIFRANPGRFSPPCFGPVRRPRSRADPFSPRIAAGCFGHDRPARMPRLASTGIEDLSAVMIAGDTSSWPSMRSTARPGAERRAAALGRTRVELASASVASVPAPLRMGCAPLRTAKEAKEAARKFSDL